MTANMFGLGILMHIKHEIANGLRTKNKHTVTVPTFHTSPVRTCRTCEFSQASQEQMHPSLSAPPKDPFVHHRDPFNPPGSDRLSMHPPATATKLFHRSKRVGYSSARHESVETFHTWCFGGQMRSPKKRMVRWLFRLHKDSPWMVKTREKLFHIRSTYGIYIYILQL